MPNQTWNDVAVIDNNSNNITNGIIITHINNDLKCKIKNAANYFVNLFIFEFQIRE